VIATTATSEVSPIRGTCSRGRPTGNRLAGPLPDASAGPADVIQLGYVGLEGSPGAVGEGLRALLDALPIVAGAGIP
jgi:hypothetical protein